MRPRAPAATLTAVLAVTLAGVTPSPALARPEPIVALAPVDTLITGQRELVGVAVAPDGTVYVSDRKDGTVLRLTPAGQLTLAVAGLDHPMGLALDLEGRLLIAEEKAERVVRLEPAGRLTVLASGIRKPRWLAVAADGTVYIAAHRLLGPDGSDPDEAKVIIRRTPGGALGVVATDVRHLEALALNGHFLHAAARRVEALAKVEGAIVRYPVLADGLLGSPVYFLATGFEEQPRGLVLDRLGALYAGSKELKVGGTKVQRAIGKVHPDGLLTELAHELEDPRGLALGPDGSLYVADGDAGRLLRLRAPPAPAFTGLPAFTRQSPLTVTGTAEGRARVDLFVNDAATALTTTAPATGRFTLPVPLALNTANTLEALATAAAGNGLTSAPVEVTVTHDSVAPLLAFQAPPALAHVRQSVAIQAEASDGGSGIAQLVLGAGRQPLTASLVPTPPAGTVAAGSTWDTSTVADGAVGLSATATDRAGNTATLTRSVIVDNTPPETRILTGPSGTTSLRTVTFTFTGTDNLTPTGSLQFLWRLDGGPFRPSAGATAVTLPDLPAGLHTFEVTALDLAGNEDPTPAVQSFTVSRGPVITGTDPSSGPIGTSVTIDGAGFVPGGTAVAFNGTTAVVRSLTATRITTTVPPGATSGLLTATTAAGTGSAPFTVPPTGDFTLTASPESATAVAGDGTAFSLAAGGGGSFTGLVALSVSAPAEGITAAFSSVFVAPGGSVTLSVAVAPTVVPGSYLFTVTGQAQVDGRPLARTANVSVTVLPAATPAVAGRILTAESIPRPIPGVTVTLGAAFVQTDAGGNFVLLAPPPGPSMLFVDGRTGSTPAAQFPIVEVQIDVAATGATRVPFVVYLPKLDTANAVTLPTDATGTVTRTVAVTTPAIPGLDVTIPAGTRITDGNGNPVNELVITPVPIDRSPMPFPPGVTPAMLFAINPGGAVPSQPLPITFPNTLDAPPGARADLYYFDLATGGWKTWGTGTVSDDARQVVSDPGYGLPRLAWHFWARVRDALKRLWKAVTGGDPVDLATGVFSVDKTDLVLPGRLPVSVQRSYRSDDTRSGFFGIGWNLGLYDARLTASGNTLTLTTTDQNTLVLSPTRFDAQGQPIEWTGGGEATLLGTAVTRLPGESNFQVRYKDGTVHRFERIIGFGNQAGLVAITDRSGNTITLTRESPAAGLFGLITRITEPAGRSLTLAYDPAGRITSVTDPINRVVRYTYDGQGRLETVTDAAGGMTRYAYDGQHRIVSITDPRSITYLTNQYDAQGRVTRQTQADGGVWQFTYTATGDIVTETRVTDPRGNTTTHRFNSQGLARSTTDALGQTTIFEYAPGSSLLRSTTDPLGRVTRFTYDAQGNLGTMTDPAGNARTFTYEPTFNQTTSMTDELGQTTQFQYDSAGNLVAAIDPLNNRTTLTYNGFGQVTAIGDPLSNTQTFSYDALGNRVAVSNAMGPTTRREYDAGSRMVGRADAMGRRTSFAYDALNRLVSIQDSAGGVTQTTYDPNGNRLVVVDPANNTTTQVYDALNRLMMRTDAAGHSETFTYDSRHNLVAHTDRNGRVSRYTYDPRDRLVTASYADGASARLEYDAIERLVTAVDSVSGTVGRSYDDLDRLTSETTDRGTILYRYDALGRQVQMTAPGQTPVHYHYDAGSQLSVVRQGLQTVTFEYDAAGRRTRLALPNQVSTEYQYDPTSRVIGLVYRSPNGVLGNLAYDYDAVGRRVAEGGSFARALLAEPIAQTAYGPGNRQTRYGDATLTYDNNGSLTSLSDDSGTTTFTWDTRNRLTAVNGPDSTHTFLYDALGRRIGRMTNGLVIDYLYDRLNVVEEARDDGMVSYLRAPWQDEVFARSSGEFYLMAGPGSVIAIADAQGAVSSSYTYEAFGEVAITGVPTANPLAFTSREHDAAGLYSYRGRYYSPRLRRFLSEDPIGFAGGDPNLYAYVHNNPIAFNDPAGLDATTWRPGPGRTRGDGPRNGNWGGARWSGGLGPGQQGPPAPPVDSGDECYMGHDLCWDVCAQCPAIKRSCMRGCDRQIVQCLRNLSDDPRQWPRPPRPDTVRDSDLYRRGAILHFATPAKPGTDPYWVLLP